MKEYTFIPDATDNQPAGETNDKEYNPTPEYNPAPEYKPETGYNPMAGEIKAEKALGAEQPEPEGAEDSAEFKTRKVFSSDEIAMFCDQIAMLLNGGISIYEGTFMLYSDMEDAATKQVLRHVDEQVQKNIPLYKALKSTGAFPDYMIHMVRVGEKTGRLETVMKSLAEFYERDSRVKAGIRSAVAYPMILFSVMACIMVVLVWKILPMFERMFDELSSDVAEATENVLTAGLAAGRVIAIIICGLFLIALVVVLLSKTRFGAKVLKKAANGFGPVRKIMELMATGKFVSSMALMMSSGMDISESLAREAENCENEKVRERIRKCGQMYSEGQPFDEAVRCSGLITGMEARLISVAAKTGETDVVFTKLSEQYNDRTSAALGKLTTIIETILVVVLSVMVGAVLLAVMMPLVSMISSIG